MLNGLPILGTNTSNQPVTLNVERLVETRMLIQANSGAGKSWALRRILEQTHGRVQHLVIDVEDEFHTLREKFDYVLAGRHGGDCPADVRSAPLLARRLLELGVSSIIGIFELKHHDRIRFVRLFLESLVNAPRELWRPVLVVVDEAHMFCPEKDQAESASAVIDLMTRGRKRGFCGLLATQRLSKLAKDAAAEANNKLIGRSALDVDMKRAADELGFNSREDQARLRTLQPGQFFAFGPAISTSVIEIKIGTVETTHPKVGQRSASAPPPRDTVRKLLAQLADLPKEAEQEAQTAAELRRRVQELERELRAKPKPEPAAPPKIERVEVPILKDSHAKALESSAERFAQAASKVSDVAGGILDVLKKLRNGHDRPLAPPPAKIPIQRTVPVAASPANGPRDDSSIGKGERAILNAIAQYPDGATREQLAVLTGYKATSRYEFLRKLTARGLVVQTGDRIIATDRGFEELGADFQPLPTGTALRDYWLSRLPEGERKILAAVIEAGTADREFLQAQTGYKSTSLYEFSRKLLARRLVVQVKPGTLKASEDLL